MVTKNRAKIEWMWDLNADFPVILKQNVGFAWKRKWDDFILPLQNPSQKWEIWFDFGWNMLIASFHTLSCPGDRQMSSETDRWDTKRVTAEVKHRRVWDRQMRRRGYEADESDGTYSLAYYLFINVKALIFPSGFKTNNSVQWVLIQLE